MSVATTLVLVAILFVFLGIYLKEERKKMNGITLNPGTMYIGLPGEDPIPVKETQLIEAKDIKDDVDAENIIRVGDALSEVSIAVEMTRQAMEKFLMEIMGVHKHVLDIMREEGHKNVYHLAVHAKKRRVRKKNFNRACRILAKEDDHAQTY